MNKENKQHTKEDVVSDFVAKILREADPNYQPFSNDCLDIKGNLPGENQNTDPFNLKKIVAEEEKKPLNETLLIEFMKLQNNTPTPTGIMTTTNPYYNITIKGLEKPIVIKTTKLRKLMHDHIAGFHRLKDKNVVCYVMKVPRQLLLDNAE